MDIAASAVEYDGLPSSSGGAHGLGRMPARTAFEAWMRFLATRTDGGDVTAVYELRLAPRTVQAHRLRRAVARAFPVDPWLSGLRPVATARLDEALSLLESLEPIPTDRWGMAPVTLSCRSRFRLLHPDGGLWPGQDPARFPQPEHLTFVPLGSSATSLELSARRSMTLNLTIPEATDADLARIVPWLQEALPVRLSANHWRRWTLTKDGNSYRPRRIVPPGLA